MGFFADLKEDLSQAVNELMPQEQLTEAEEAKADEVQSETEKKDTGGENALDFASEISLDEMLKNIDEFRLPEDETSMGEETVAEPAADAMADIADAFTPDGAVGQEADALTEQTADPAAGLWMVEELPEDADAETQKAEDTVAEPEGTMAGAEETQAAPAWNWKAPETEAVAAVEETAEEVVEAEVTAAETAATGMETVAGTERTEDAEMAETQTADAAAWGWKTSETETAAAEEVSEEQEAETISSQMHGESPAPEPQVEQEEAQREEIMQEEVMQEEVIIQVEESKGAEETMEMNERVVLDETSIITAGMVVKGDINTEGSVDVAGTVNGNIDAYGKLNITGHINGNSKAAEIYAENAKINGQVVSEGAVKIEASTVIIGNITATSAAIAGAVKGDIDVRGPVILDASAIVMGNIKSKSVQINNGAVIEGMCSQCYADVNPISFFDDYKPDAQTKSKAK